MPDQLTQYYDYLKKAGADVPPTFESFKSTLSDEPSAKQYYDYLKSNKFDAPDTFDSFANTLGLKKKEPSVPSAPVSGQPSSVPSPSPSQLPSVEDERGKISLEFKKSLASKKSSLYKESGDLNPDGRAISEVNDLYNSIFQSPDYNTALTRIKNLRDDVIATTAGDGELRKELLSKLETDALGVGQFLLKDPNAVSDTQGLTLAQKAGLDYIKVFQPERYDALRERATVNANTNSSRVGQQLNNLELENIGLSVLKTGVSDFYKRVEDRLKKGEITTESNDVKNLNNWTNYIKKIESEREQRYPEALSIKAQQVVNDIDQGRLSPLGRFSYNFYRSTGGAIEDGVRSIMKRFMNDEDRINSELESIERDAYSFLGSVGQDASVVNRDYLTVVSDGVKAKLKEIDSDSTLTDDQKFAKKSEVIKTAKPNDIYTVANPEKSKINLNSESILGIFTTVVPQIVGGLATSYLTGGFGSTTKAGQLANLFTTTAITSYGQRYNQEIASGVANPEFYAISGALIDAATEMGFGNDIAQIKKVYGNGVGGKILSKLSDADWNRLMSSRNVSGGLVKAGKDLGGDVIAETVGETAAQTGENILKGNDITEGLKETAISTIVGMSAFRGPAIPKAAISENIGVKLAFYNGGVNSEITKKAIEDQVDAGDITRQEADKRIAAVNKMSGIINAMPMYDKNGKPLSDVDKAKYAYNEYIKSEAKNASSTLPGKQAQEMADMAAKADKENGDIIDGATENAAQELSNIESGMAVDQAGQLTINRDGIKSNATVETDRIKSAAPEEETGVTMNLDGTTYTGGGLVIPAASMNTTQEDLTPEMLADFIEQNKSKLGDGETFKVGYYKFPNSNNVSIDLNIVADPKNRDAALRFGRMAGQESLFDLDTFENVKTGADGMNPRSFSDEEFADIARSLKDGKLPSFMDVASRAKSFIIGEDETTSNVAEALKPTGIRITELPAAEFEARVKEVGGQGSEEGVFIADNGEIVLNKDTASDITKIHEGAHPVMNIIFNTNRSLYDQAVAGMQQAAANNQGIQGAIEFGKQYEGEATQNDEALVETIARIGTGDIDINTIDTGFKQTLIDFVNRIAKVFGFEQVLNDTDVAAFKRLAARVAESLREGKDISEIVGKENVGRFEVNLGEKQFVDKDKFGQLSKPRDLVSNAGLRKQMTEDGDNYVFFHYSDKKIKQVDPSKFGKNLATGRDERPGVGISMYYTRPDQLETNVPGDYGYSVRIPKDQVYPFNQDPLNLMPQAEKLFKKDYPGQAFDTNKQVGYVTKVAAARGYPMTVAEWTINGKKGLRAQTTEKLTVKPYRVKDPMYLNVYEFKEEFTPNALKKGQFSKSRIPNDPLSKEAINSIRRSLRVKAPDSYTLEVLDGVVNYDKNDIVYDDVISDFADNGISLSNIANLLIEDGIVDDRSKAYSYFVSIGGMETMGLFGKTQFSKSRLEKDKNFKIAAFVMKEKAEGTHDQEIFDGIKSVMPNMSDAEIMSAVSDPEGFIRTKFSNLSSAVQENLISRARATKTTAGMPTDIDPAFSQLETRPEDIEAATQRPSKVEEIKKKVNEVKNKYFDAAKGLPNWIMGVKDITGGVRDLEIRKAVDLSKELKNVAASIGFTDWDAFTKAMKSLTPEDVQTSNSTGIQPWYANIAAQNKVLSMPPAVLPAEIAALPEEIRPYVFAMRGMVDGLTKDLIGAGFVTPEQAKILESNIGSYLNRAYRLFNENGYKPSDEDFKQAIKYFSDIYIKQLATQNAGVLTFDQISKQAAEMARKTVNEILDKDLNPYFKKGEKRDVSILKERKDIPEPIRKLMGEYTDPVTVFVMTVAKQAALRGASQYLTALRNNGMGTMFFEKNDPNRPAEFSHEIAGEGSETMSPLNGLYTTPEIADALDGVEDTLNSLTQTWMKLVGAIRWGKTVGSVVTQVKNMLSNIGFAVMNGLIFTGKNMKSLSGAGKYWSGQVTGRKLDDLTQKVMALGLVNQSVGASELRRMLGSADMHDIAVELAVTGKSKGAINWISKPFRALNKAYQLSDDFWKVYAYMNERELVSNAMFGEKYENLTPEQQVDVDLESSERVKNTWPTYSRVWEGAKYVSERAPIFGNFISFQAESVRVLGNTFKLAMADIKSGDPAFAAIGYKRLAGMITYVGLRSFATYAAAHAAGIGAAGLMGLFDDDEEKNKEEGLRTALPAFMRTGDLLAIPQKDGQYTVFDLSSIDPYGIVFKSLNALTEGREGIVGDKMEPGVAAAMAEFFSGFLEPEMTFRVMMDVANNSNPKTGGNIYREDDSRSEALLNVGKYIGDQLKPSTIGFVERLMGDNRKAEIGAVFGARPYEVDLYRSFGRVMATNGKNFEDIIRGYNRVKYDKKATEAEKKEAEKKAEQDIAYYADKMSRVYRQFLSLGADPKKLNEMIANKSQVKSTGWSKGLKRSIKTGEITPDKYLK